MIAPARAGAIEYERFDDRQRVRLDGRIIGYVRRTAARKWVALDVRLRVLGEAPRRRDATALLPGVAEATR